MMHQIAYLRRYWGRSLHHRMRRLTQGSGPLQLLLLDGGKIAGQQFCLKLLLIAFVGKCMQQAECCVQEVSFWLLHRLSRQHDLHQALWTTFDKQLGSECCTGPAEDLPVNIVSWLFLPSPAQISQVITNLSGDALDKPFWECRRTTMSLATQDLALLSGLLPDACPKKFAVSCL